MASVFRAGTARHWLFMRKSTFTHRSGGVVDLPLVVPSFSSKGFDYFSEKVGSKKVYRSEATIALDALGNFLDESFLISAYDLHHNHFRKPERFYKNTAIIIFDSGGYEMAPEFDSSEPKMTPLRELPPFERHDYVKVLTSLYKKHSHRPFLIANYDWGTRFQPYIDQIRDARRLFREFPDWSTNFILKPNKPKGTVVDVDQIGPIVSELRKFDVIGVTEKELGRGLMDRLKRLLDLRLALNAADIDAPIHIWGGLDPIITPLYFFAGADMFDGISWLRYGYHDGVAVNRESHCVLNGNLTISHDHSVALAQSDNLMALQGLATSMRAFANSETPNFDMFDGRGELFEKTYKVMDARIKRLKELK